MKEIPLTKGYVTWVDDEDFERLARFKWAAWSSNGFTYAYRRVQVRGVCFSLLMHHEIVGGVPDGMIVDHKNNDTLLNTRQNLRICTQAQNLQNRKPANKTGLPKGVTRHHSKFIACIGNKRDGTYKRFYGFDTIAKAALAYDVEASRRYGEFAWLNCDHYAIYQDGSLPIKLDCAESGLVAV